MIYKSIQPGIHLREYIKDYLLLHFEFEKGETIPVKPYPACPKQGIIFYIRGSVISSNPAENTFEKRAQTVIFGQPVSRQNLHLPENYLAVSVRFLPGSLFKFLNIPMIEFLNKNIDAELILGYEIKAINEQLANTPSYDTMIEIIEAFLLKRIRQIKEQPHPVDKIGQLIFEYPQAFSLDEFAGKACLSASQLERRFVQQVGVPPKYFARICRFSQALIMKEKTPSISWFNIAMENGYTDYQHLVRDFKEFSGTTPAILFQEESNSPEQYLGLNPDFATN